MRLHLSTKILLISFILVAASCLIGLAQAAPGSRLQETGPETTTVPSSSTTSTTTTGERNIPTTTATQSQPTLETTIIKRNNSARSTNAETSATPAPTHNDDPEPATSTTDSIGVNSDETTKSAEPADDDTSASDTSNEESTSNDENNDRLPGIEPKSIGGSRDENRLGKEETEASAKLSIDKNETGDENNADDDEGKRPKIGHKMSNAIVNMTLVDQMYLKGHKDEQATVEDWNKMQKQLKKGISGIIGSMVPFALNMSQEAKISSDCSGAMLKWILNMNQLKAWALRMLDASGKPIAGLLEGSMTMFGNYRQCLKVRAPDDDEIEFAGEFREHFRGKYCIVQAKPWLPEKSRFYNLNTKLSLLAANSEDEENQWYDRTIFEELSEWLLAFNYVNIRFDICVPSLCKREDLQKAINYLMNGVDLKARILRCEMEPMNGTLGMAAQVESGSSEIADALHATTQNVTDQFHLEQYSQLGWILIPFVATLFVLLATALSMTIGSDDQEKTTKIKHTIKSFSLKRSVSSHLNVDYDQLSDDKPLALYGIRFILVIWVILVESAVNLKFEYLRELMMLKDLLFWWPMQFIINSTMQYDSFILLTAFTMGYKNCLNDGINNARALTRFVLDKYIRLMPSIMVMVALVILMPLMYRGPVWNDYVTKQSAICQSTGWINTIFLQNYLPYDRICLPQTWLLCVELQLVLLMAPIVYYLNKNYTTNYGGPSSKALSFANGSTIKRPDLLTISTSRREDSSKAFHWFWTTPGTLLMTCILIGLGTSFYNVYYNDLPPSWFYTMADPDSKALYFGEHMTKIWTHLAVFAMGLLAGLECRRATRNITRSYRSSNISLMSQCVDAFSKQPKSHSSTTSLPVFTTSSKQHHSKHDDLLRASTGHLSDSSISINFNSNSRSGMLNSSSCTIESIGNNYNINNTNHKHQEDQMSSHTKGNDGRSCCSILLNILGSVVAIAVMSAIIFSTHSWSLNDLPKPLVAGLFDAGSRFLWSLALMWILYMVSVPDKSKNFSLLARSLGHPAMVCLGKLSFLIYIIHPFVHTLVLAIQEQPIYSSWLMLFHILIGNITITVILASLVSLFVEMPFRNLFRRCGTSLLLTQTASINGGGSGGSASVTTQSSSIG